MRVSRLILWILSVAFLLTAVVQPQNLFSVRWTTVVIYRNHEGITRFDLVPTGLLPDAHGKAEVEAKKGEARIAVGVKDMVPASVFGAEYLTYVLWANHT
jgi:hypothetical protein